MSFRNLMPLAHTSLLHAQAGTIMAIYSGVTTVGHSHGHGGGGSGQIFKEFIFGDECAGYTAADNTTGTLFYPDIKYICAIKEYSYNNLGGGPISCGMQAQSIIGDDLEKDGTYDPDASPLGSINLYSGDEVFGKFNRVTIERAASASYSTRLLLTIGV